MIKVIVVGAAGRMGRETVLALNPKDGFEVVGAIGKSNCGRTLRDLIGPTAPDLILEEKLGAAIERTGADVVIDYAHYASTANHADTATRRGVPIIFGTTGISEGDVKAIRAMCEERNVPAMIVPNFAIGAVLMMHFAEIAAHWLPDCEIIEMHHDRKEDAPSGTALLTAQKIGRSRTREKTRLPRPSIKVEGARGGVVAEVPVHSVRLPGLLAHQIVMFGAPGEVLTLRHDSTDRKGFMEGVKLCTREVKNLTGLTIGMERLLFQTV